MQLFLDFELPPEQRPLALLSPDEIFHSATHDLLETLGEDCRLERKPATIHREPLAEYFSMWANTAPEGGIIALGIADKGTLVGCGGLNQTQLNDIEKTGKSRAVFSIQKTSTWMPSGHSRPP